jgi:lantibiotic transport system ATP-binding protein
MRPEPVLVCRGLTKKYRGHAALNAVDVEIREGEVFGLLGPNGAGKTTFIRMILGLGLPQAGSISVFGMDLFTHRRQVLRHLGAVVEAPVFLEYLSGLENLGRLVGLTRGLPEAQLLDSLQAVGLREAARAKVGTYSYGMKQRLGIAQALLPDTRLLILDEPTNGLDPHGIAGMRRLIRQLALERRMSVLISSHLLAEIEQVCDRVAIIHKGCCLVQTCIDDLRAQGVRVEIDVRGAAAPAAELGRQTAATASYAAEAEGTTTLVYRDPVDVPDLIRRLVHAGAEVLRVENRRESLEEVFLRLTRTGDSDVRIDAF